jgi:Transposase, Mutator family
VQLAVSDAHTGLKQAIAAVMAGTCWHRCRVRFLRNLLARVPRGSAEMVAAAIRTIFAQPTGQEVVDRVDKVAAMLQPKFPAVATMLLDSREDLTAFEPGTWVAFARLPSTVEPILGKNAGIKLTITKDTARARTGATEVTGTSFLLRLDERRELQQSRLRRSVEDRRTKGMRPW